jgi:septal ring factor EnvC (AmiA/AmiB activator)
MRFLPTCAVLLSFCAAVPAFSQNTVLVAAGTPANAPASVPTATSAAPSTAAPAAHSGPVDLTGFKESIANKNKALTDQVTSEKAIVKKNGEILQDAKKIDIANKKLEAQRKALEAQNAELDKERQQIMAEEKAASGN